MLMLVRPWSSRNPLAGPGSGLSYPGPGATTPIIARPSPPPTCILVLNSPPTSLCSRLRPGPTIYSAMCRDFNCPAPMVMIDS